MIYLLYFVLKIIENDVCQCSVFVFACFIGGSGGLFNRMLNSKRGFIYNGES